MSGYTRAVYEDYLHERVDTITKVVIDTFVDELSKDDQSLLEVYLQPEIALRFSEAQKLRANSLMYLLELELGTHVTQLINRSLQHLPRYVILRSELEQCAQAWGARFMEDC